MPKDVKDVIDQVIAREVDPSDRSKISNDPADKGGRTAYGISEKANPDLWKDGPPTEAQSRERYEQRYIRYPGFDKITDKQLQSQLIDFGVNSGPGIAVKKLQEILQVEVDGVLGPETLGALEKCHPEDINNLLVGARVRMIGKIVSKNPSQLKWLNGWLARAVEWLT